MLVPILFVYQIKGVPGAILGEIFNCQSPVRTLVNRGNANGQKDLLFSNCKNGFPGFEGEIVR